ncbi:MAG: putative metal-dependent enzyme (double-stranded beta helix superfamily) [Verrucomicrobiales bacterium]|jgi:predicted metal-dependent enzyme (double-stranded beta helix superfamily)
MRSLNVPLLRRRCATGLVALVTCSAQAAEVFQASPKALDELPKGKEADGIPGDFILRSDKVEAVISQLAPLRRANMSTFYGADGMTPGCLYDLTIRDADNDQITIFAPSGQRGDVSYVWPVERDLPDGVAAVESVTSAADNDGLYKRHEYLVRDGMQGVVITSTFKNEGKEAKKVTTADTWTNVTREESWRDIKMADAMDPADKAGYAYAWIPEADGASPPSEVSLSPGEELTVRRFLAVGTSPAEAFGIVAAKLGETGTAVFQVNEAESAIAVGSATIEITTSDRKMLVAYPDAEGKASIALPAGDYTVRVLDTGRTPALHALRVVAGEENALVSVLGKQSGVQFEISDAAAEGSSMPCKVQFHGINGTPTPDLGPGNRAHGCKEQWHSATGHFTVPIAPGNYRVVVTRGPEYSHHAADIEVKADTMNNVQASLRRMIDTSGWVATDFHNHSTPSGDNTCKTDDRIINLVAEHIEFAPTTEHNRIYDWAPHIASLKVGDYLSTIPGLELTGSGAHFNTFPLKPEPTKQDGGAPVWDPDPRINALSLRQLQGYNSERYIQINHPDLAENFVDRDGDGTVDGGFAFLGGLIDAYETQNYLGVGILKKEPVEVRPPFSGGSRVKYNREFIWLQFLNQGMRVWAVAVADAHTVWGNGVGGWRTYVQSSKDAPSEIDPKEMAANAQKGRMMLTTGPYLTATVNGDAQPGDEIKIDGDKVNLAVRVQCNDWLDIDRVQVLVNGRQIESLNFTRASHPDMFTNGIVKFDQSIEIPLKEDSHIIAVAMGENFTLKTGFGNSPQHDMQPCAYHNPIFVDLGSDGFQPNKDTLGHPLPVKGLTPDKVRRILGKD